MSNTDKVQIEIANKIPIDCDGCYRRQGCNYIKFNMSPCIYQKEIANQILSIKELHVEAEEQTPIPFNEAGKTGETFIRCEPKEEV